MLGSRLKYPIEIIQKVKVKDSIGHTSYTDQLVAAVKADVQLAIGRAVNKEDLVVNQTEATFYIRNHPTMSYEYFIKFNGDNYQVLAIQPMLDGSGQIIKAVRNG